MRTECIGSRGVEHNGLRINRKLALKIHGTFEEKTDDFDETKHSLDLGLKTLSAFRRKPKTALR